MSGGSRNQGSSDVFGNTAVRTGILRRRTFNYRWAEQPADVIHLTAAEPDFPAPSVVSDVICTYARGGYFSYGPKTGLSEFCEAASSVMLTRKEIAVPASRILPIDSAARAMFVMAASVLEPGDEASVFDPVDTSSRVQWKQPVAFRFSVRWTEPPVPLILIGSKGWFHRERA